MSSLAPIRKIHGSAEISLCSRPVTHLLQTFLPGKTFAPIVTRDFRPAKPDPAGILHIASQWGLEDGGQSLIMVRAFPSLSAGNN